MPGGTYTLLVTLPNAARIEVGALGECAFPAGWYAYTGSALGPGGFARVDRHHEVAAGDRDTRHWHVDSLLGDTGARIATVVRSPGVAAECAVARAVESVGDVVVPGFGATDCDCGAHLHHHPERGPLLAAVRDAHGEGGAGAQS
ncbi:MAG: DUF123 domain-containing protein [Halorientalis sp.]